ncbi:MAG: alkaline phosphatase D family protein [Planctomycetales bacterium]|nr:alkaline phosphatase D family protein [Planctomycetales bacterium]
MPTTLPGAKAPALSCRFPHTAAAALSAAVVIMLVASPSAFCAELAMGLRVGEVTQTSAIVWTRVTRDKQRVWDGYREPSKRTPKSPVYTPSEIKIEQRDGATPGARGQLRVSYADNRELSGPRETAWVEVDQASDYSHQFQLTGLKAATRYFLRVDARDAEDGPITASAEGTFATPAEASQWQDVRFGVITGQSYWDLDHREGFHIYPAMAKENLSFIVPTGDTVYLDSEAPRARTIELARYHWQRMYSLPRHVAFHKEVPGYWEVDDHDTWCDDCWPTLRAAWMNPLTFAQGFAVYREQVPMGAATFRTARWGSGLQVWMVEGRLFRSPNTMPDGPDKTIWGREQLEWLKRTILESDADFRVLISPTPIVGPDRDRGKRDNHANDSFQTEGEHFRQWTKQQQLKNFFTCCGDRHWQYMSVEPRSGLREFSCGPASDMHAGGNPMQPDWQPFLRVKGGFLTVDVARDNDVPTISFRHHDVHGQVVHEHRQAKQQR